MQFSSSISSGDSNLESQSISRSGELLVQQSKTHPYKINIQFKERNGIECEMGFNVLLWNPHLMWF